MTATRTERDARAARRGELLTHLAARGHLGASVDELTRVLKVNAGGVTQLLRRAGAEGLVVESGGRWVAPAPVRAAVLAVGEYEHARRRGG